MQSKFGLKDFVMLTLVIGIGVSVWLGMVMEDRRFQAVRDVKLAVDSQEQTLARVERMLQQMLDEWGEGPDAPDLGYRIVHASYTPQPERQPERRPGRPGRDQQRDESWARPDVAIEWQERWSYATDPRDLEGFQFGGQFTEIFEAQPAKLTPILAQDVYGNRIVDRVCEYLAAWDPKTLRLKGQLAEAWQVDPEGLWLRVRIHRRARFSDGSPVTAEDVRWTLQDYILNPEMDTERARSIMDNIVGCEVLDERTVEFTFKEPRFNNLSQAMGFEVLPKAFYAQFTPAQVNRSTGLLMGSGPYRLERLDPQNQWTPPQEVVLVRNENYWGDRAPLDSLRFTTISDELARLTAYTNNQGDMILPSSPQFNQVRRDRPDWDRRNYSLNWVNMRSGYSFVGWQCGERNGKLTPFHDKRVRRAMTMILDREAMIRDIWDGVGQVATSPFSPVGPAHNPNIKPWPYDLEAARALLAEAGWKVRDASGILKNDRGDEFVFEFTRAEGGEVSKRIGDYVKSQCARAGIRCNVRVQDWSVYVTTLATRDFDAIIMGWSANSPESDLSQMFHSRSILNQGDNFIQWNNADADRLLETGLRTIDHEQRMKIWHELGALLHEEQPYSFVRVPPWLRFVRKDFGNVNAYPKGLEPWEFFKGTSSSLERGL